MRDPVPSGEFISEQICGKEVTRLWFARFSNIEC